MIIDTRRWVKKFTSMGHNVVLMDQTNTTKATSNQRVGRGVKRVFTPGTLGDIWSSDSSNYLVAIKVCQALSHPSCPSLAPAHLACTI